MRIKEGFEMRDVCGEKVVVAHGLQHINFSRVISMNESAAFLWEHVCGCEFTPSRLVELLCGEYDVSVEQAAEDVDKLIECWKKEGLLLCED